MIQVRPADGPTRKVLEVETTVVEIPGCGTTCAEAESADFPARTLLEPGEALSKGRTEHPPPPTPEGAST